MYSEESRVVLAANNGEFGTGGGYLGDRPSMPVSCYAAAATVAAGVAAAFLTGAVLVAGAHHFGGHHHFQPEGADGGSPVAGGSVQSLIDALSAA